MSSAVRRELAALNPSWEAARFTTVRLMLEQAAEEMKVGITADAPLVGFALLLTVLGVYGLVSFVVSRRTKEIGIRLALGAGRVDVWRLIARQVLVWTAVGLLIGCMGAGLFNRIVGSMIPAVATLGFGTVGLAVLLPITTAMMGMWIPVRRAMRMNPLTALRVE